MVEEQGWAGSEGAYLAHEFAQGGDVEVVIVLQVIALQRRQHAQADIAAGGGR